MAVADDPRSRLLGYRIERDGSAPERWRVLDPEGSRVPGVFADLPAAERFIVMRELRALELRPRRPSR